MSDKKILIAYYSHSGNTKEAAEKIQSLTGADLFEIKPANEYPKDYNAVVNQAKQEKADDVRPELVSLGNVKAYDILFIGTPVWWYTGDAIVYHHTGAAPWLLTMQIPSPCSGISFIVFIPIFSNSLITSVL